MISWLLTIRAGGREFRHTTAPAEQRIWSETRGIFLVFSPGLDDPAPTESSDNAEGLEIPIGVSIDEDLWAQLCNDNTGGWTAELAWYGGGDWETRRVLADGRVDSPVYGPYGEPVTFSIVDVPWDDRGQIPSPTQVIGATSWPVQSGYALPDQAVGSYYPYVFGAPGLLYAGDGLTQFAGWPALIVEIDAVHRNNHGGGNPATLLLAGHKMAGSTVTIYNLTQGGSTTAVVSQTTDLLGQLVSVAYVTGSDLHIDEGDEIWAAATSASGGGVQRPDGQVARGMGDVTEWLLRASSLRVSWSRLTQLQRLQAFNCDFYVNQPSSPWAIINDMLLAGGLFPAFWRRDAQGYYLAVKPWENAEKVSLLSIDLSSGDGDRVGEVSVSSSAELATDILLRYAKDESVGIWRRTLAYSPLPGSYPTLQNAYAQATWARLGYRRSVEIEVPGVQDPGTARILLDLVALARSAPIRSIRYAVPYDARIQVGAVVLLTDPEIRCNRRLFWVTETQVSAQDGWMQVGLEELIDFLRTSQGGQ